jgi:hypothetical protein
VVEQVCVAGSLERHTGWIEVRQQIRFAQVVVVNFDSYRTIDEH